MCATCEPVMPSRTDILKWVVTVHGSSGTSLQNRTEPPAAPELWSVHRMARGDGRGRLGASPFQARIAEGISGRKAAQLT
jgi:hypothetical protein